MDNVNIILATNIQNFRKRLGFTQEELAQKLGVTFQAVSKWENTKSAPDISFLPVMADLFDCSIDQLFSRDMQSNIKYYTEFPWSDDDIIRGVVCEGRKILQVTDKITEKFTFEIIGDAKSVESKCNIEVSGNVSGGCNAGRSITVGGNLSGGANCGKSINVECNLSGGCNCGMSIQCGCNIQGDVNCGRDVTAMCDIHGDVHCEKNVTAGGNIEAEIIKCNKVHCETLECKSIDKNVSIK
ncbi:MAG: helix-turn-helix domain-containing protein [Clostridia bacterium]|nr:helix-turn-helix domain-containing protein [Clostridia bacterium]